MQRVRLPLDNMRVDGALLFRLRTDRELTQAVVAERAEISEQWFRQIERGHKQPSLPVVRSIATAIGCRIEDFCRPLTVRDAA